MVLVTRQQLPFIHTCRRGTGGARRAIIWCGGMGWVATTTGQGGGEATRLQHHGVGHELHDGEALWEVACPGMKALAAGHSAMGR
jgi:hypothetical protein